jgi:hypothetical protein
MRERGWWPPWLYESCLRFNGKFLSLGFRWTRRWLIRFHLCCSESHFVTTESILREESWAAGNPWVQIPFWFLFFSSVLSEFCCWLSSVSSSLVSPAARQVLVRSRGHRSCSWALCSEFLCHRHWTLLSGSAQRQSARSLSICRWGRWFSDRVFARSSGSAIACIALTVYRSWGQFLCLLTSFPCAIRSMPLDQRTQERPWVSFLGWTLSDSTQQPCSAVGSGARLVLIEIIVKGCQSSIWVWIVAGGSR